MNSFEQNGIRDHTALINVIDRFDGRSVLVIGDVMLDRYWWGTVSRISPEAPVPVVLHERSTLAAGGAANVAANIAGLSGRPSLVGLIGDDEGGRELPTVLDELGVSTDHLITFENRPTTVKTRIVAHSQHVVRLDKEDAGPISEENEEAITQRVLNLLPSVDVVVISDYAKGMLTPAILSVVISEARKSEIPVLVDPKGVDYVRYDGATLITPNRAEAIHASGVDGNDPRAVELAGERLLDLIDISACLITQGEEGMTLFLRGDAPFHLTAMAREVYDVTGAGDTVIAALGLAVSAGADLLTAASIANLAAGLAVEQVGTTVLSLELLRQHLETLDSASQPDENAVLNARPV
jgi:D-beta-D-heptose 7-phosphate kinase/D-beta-D-heptose 1-phosphate adenosyltransferase